MSHGGSIARAAARSSVGIPVTIRRILLVDDESGQLSNTCAAFGDRFVPEIVRSGEAGRARPVVEGHAVPVAVCASVLPDMAGISFPATAAAIAPDTIRVLVSVAGDLGVGALDEHPRASSCAWALPWILPFSSRR